MSDLFNHLLQIQTSPAAPFWLRLIVALVLAMPVILMILAVQVCIGLLRHGRVNRQFARRMGWKWESGGAFSGRLANHANWEGGAYANENIGAYLNWSGGPLACRTENKLYVVSRAEYERQRSSTVVQPQLPELAGGSAASIASASTAVASQALAQPAVRAKNEALWLGDPAVQACPIDNRAFEERFVLLSNNRSFAYAAFPDTAVRQLLDWDAVVPERFRVKLTWNRLVLELKPGPVDHCDIEKFGQLALTIAESANASNGAAYWSRKRAG